MSERLSQLILITTSMRLRRRKTCPPQRIRASSSWLQSIWTKRTKSMRETQSRKRNPRKIAGTWKVSKENNLPPSTSSVVVEPPHPTTSGKAQRANVRTATTTTLRKELRPLSKTFDLIKPLAMPKCLSVSVEVWSRGKNSRRMSTAGVAAELQFTFPLTVSLQRRSPDLWREAYPRTSLMSSLTNEATTRATQREGGEGEDTRSWKCSCSHRKRWSVRRWSAATTSYSNNNNRTRMMTLTCHLLIAIKKKTISRHGSTCLNFMWRVKIT